MVGTVDAMLRTLRARLRHDDDPEAWRRACGLAYAESARTTLPTMTDAQLEARLGWKLQQPKEAHR
jgi:hypothetical protein